VDLLYWVGCAGSFDEKNRRVSRSLVKIMQAAGIKFGILGKEENCTGDSARRAGNEYLFQTLAATNIETLNRYGVKRIITACPHCFNTLKNEYPQLGGNYEVMHHSEFIGGLVRDGRLTLKSKSQEVASYHDSCYLGRFNDLFDDQRNLIRGAGFTLREPEKCAAEGMCCGAGGAQMWMEEKYDRVNLKRTDQLLATDPSVIATACPFCNIMMSDGVKAKQRSETVRVQDIAEIVANSIE
jgi:Fe-S oxidoreductase